MTKRKSTKSALITSVLALFLCFAMLLGSTFAWFTDSVASANNIITSGNLDIVVEYQEKPLVVLDYHSNHLLHYQSAGSYRHCYLYCFER